MAAYSHVSSAATLEAWVRISLAVRCVLVSSVCLCCTVCLCLSVVGRIVLLLVAIFCATGEVN